jgi:alkanesulfonate monooxygenase SsuD/methylene tetrahydromethanopterin reductase-like flavin-dependent oxidoreductase (luciferase family)
LPRLSRRWKVKIGIGLAQSSWPDVETTWSFAQIAEYGVRAETVGFDSLWTNDHFFFDLPGRARLGGPEPMTMLAYLAGRTERVQLGTLVACGPFRSPGQLAREAKTLAELSGGRFILGLGAGWHQPEFDAFDIPFDHRVARFEEYLEAVIALLGDEPVDYDGRYVKLRRAEIAGRAAPPIWIGTAGPRMLALTGKHANGWNLAGPWETFSERLATVRQAEAAAGRPQGSVVASAGASALLVDDGEAERLLAGYQPMGHVAVGVEGLRALVEDHRQKGCDHLILHFSGGIWSSYGVEQLDLAAEALRLR